MLLPTVTLHLKEQVMEILSTHEATGTKRTKMLVRAVYYRMLRDRNARSSKPDFPVMIFTPPVFQMQPAHFSTDL